MHVINPVRRWLQAEGFAVLAFSAIAYFYIGANWWLFAVLLLTPDLSILPYLLNPRAGAISYNLAHNYLFPLFLACLALILRSDAILPYVLIWTAHIGMDRMLGYGLKYASAFTATHLSDLSAKRQR